MTLDKMKERKKGKVTSIQGDNHFISRITANGLTMGSTGKNAKKSVWR